MKGKKDYPKFKYKETCYKVFVFPPSLQAGINLSLFLLERVKNK